MNTEKNSKQKGDDYENFVQRMMEALNDDEVSKTGTIKLDIQKNIQLRDRQNTLRQFDIYWSYEFMGVNNQVIIECKNYNKKNRNNNGRCLNW
jgi:hypothetical protein